MYTILLLLNFFLLIVHQTYTMDYPSPSVPKKKEPKTYTIPPLPISKKTASATRTTSTLDSSTINQTPEIPWADTKKRSFTITQHSKDYGIVMPTLRNSKEPSEEPFQLLYNSSDGSLPQSSPHNKFWRPTIDTTDKPLLPHEEKMVKKRIVTTRGLTKKSSSMSDSGCSTPQSSPRKTSSPRTKLSLSPHHSPRSSSSSKSSPRQATTYKVVIEEFNNNSSKIKKCVKSFLENPENNPNQQDKSTGNSMLHRAVLLHQEKIVHMLLCDPRTDSCIENKSSLKASEFIIGDDKIRYKKLFDMLRAREMLDLIINGMIITNPEIHALHCSEAFILHLIHSFLEKMLPKILPLYANPEFICTAICYRKAHKLSQLQKFYKTFQKNPNHQDKWGNTMLHYAALLLDKSLISRLIADPVLNSTTRNKYAYIPAQLIPASTNIKTKYLTAEIIQKIQYLKTIRILLFTRDSLEYLSAKEAETVRTFICPVISAFTLYKEIQEESGGQFIIKKIINPDLIETKQLIENDFKNIAKKQGDSALPDETGFPLYATNEFIYKLLQRKMKAIEIEKERKLLDTGQQADQDKFPKIFADYIKIVARENQLILDYQQELISQSSESK